MPKSSQPLNTKQTEILLILYKFRYATRELIVAYQELASSTYTQYRLVNLMKQGYIGRRYSGKDKIAGKPARYHLESRGIRFLLANPITEQFGLNPNILNLAYKDKTAHESFIDQCLSLFKLYLVYSKLYINNLDFFSKSEIAEFDYFLHPPPSAFMTFSGKYNDKPDCVLELVDSNKPYFTVRRRVNQYLKQYENNSWQNRTSTDYPDLLFIVDSTSLERRLQKTIAFSLRSRELTKLQIYTTSYESVLKLTSPNDVSYNDILAPYN